MEVFQSFYAARNGSVYAAVKDLTRIAGATDQPRRWIEGMPMLFIYRCAAGIAPFFCLARPD
jgi:hypothetical protein